MLEHGEWVHPLQRAIHIGRIPMRRGLDLAEFGGDSGALALVTNIVMAFNASELQKSVDAAIVRGTRLSAYIEAIEHVGPATLRYGGASLRTLLFAVFRNQSALRPRGPEC
jgi:hypothetical protein